MITALQSSPGQGRWVGRVLLGAMVVGLSGAASPAGDRCVVQRDGRKIRLVKSTSEFAVTFRDSKEAKVRSAARRLESSGRGVVVDIPGAPPGPVKILRVSRTTPARRSLVRRDPGIAEVHPVYRFEGSDTPVLSTGTINLRLLKHLGDKDLARVLADYRLTLVERIEGLHNVYCVRPVDDGDDEVFRAEALAYDPRTVWAQPNFRIPQRRHQATPADQFYNRQWHLNNTGQLGGTADADIDAPEAWLLGADGQDILIGMLDDSCDVEHEDLRDNYLGEGNDPSLPSTSDSFTDPRPKQVGDFHGTAVMGLAAARANTVGGRGVAYSARFTASRGLGVLTDAQVANAYLFARQKNVDVHINSWGYAVNTPVPSIVEDALETAFIEGRDLDGEEGDDPVRGMVLLFASGNGQNDEGPGVLLQAGRDLSTLPTVIGVGACDDSDRIASYSNYGPQIDVLAPGGDSFSAALTTTDNDDSAGYVDDGLNIAGIDVDGFPDIDPSGLYTGGFAGTSAACPVAAGVAALILSSNPLLTATDVRLILEHTCDKISPDDAVYHGITNRSVRYGYGRINAEMAVRSAQQSLTNGGRSWPGRPARVQVAEASAQVTWLQNGDPLEFVEEEEDEDDPSGGGVVLKTTDEFLVLESDSPFEFIPQDGKCYDRSQIGCGAAVLEPLPSNVSVLAIGCALTCGTDTVGKCEAGERQCVEFLQPAGTKYFAIYARSILGRYSFGVSADTDGNIVDPGDLPPRATGGGGSGGGGDGGVQPDVGPKVTLSVTPLEGTSPLNVRFTGNASSVLAIDDERTLWDFNLDDPGTAVAATRNAAYTYEVPPGGTTTFIARLTMYDIEGNVGFAQVAIRVIGESVDSSGGDTGETDVRIIVGVPGTVGSDVDAGTSPFQVELNIDANSLAGTVKSVVWDLGDGTTAHSLFVTHTYINNTGLDLRIPITATVTTETSGGVTTTAVVSRRITVLPGDETGGEIEVECDGCGADGGGGAASPCGAVGMLPLFVGISSLLCLRRRRF